MVQWLAVQYQERSAAATRILQLRGIFRLISTNGDRLDEVSQGAKAGTGMAGSREHQKVVGMQKGFDLMRATQLVSWKGIPLSPLPRAAHPCPAHT